MRSIAVAGLLLILTACGASVPDPNSIANSVETGHEGTTLVATVTPWPLDSTVAFFCLRQPGSAFSVETPSPPAAAGCEKANVSTSGDKLTARFDPTTLDPDSAAAFAGQQQWFLAVAGSRGPISVATTLTVLNLARPS